ncbi:MAG: hypothetical protein GVY32_01495 [Gammaproteobacteria bacterium]|jgi:hypothetical protein|nr:hypothetical protein [Gammaproteobacteria bacterium]
MCIGQIPTGLGILHALRLAADPNADDPDGWLASRGLDATGGTVRALAELIGEARLFAPPGAAAPWPHERAVMEALARVDREPERAEALLTFLPNPARLAGLALLADLSQRISAGLTLRFTHPRGRGMRLH